MKGTWNLSESAGFRRIPVGILSRDGMNWSRYGMSWDMTPLLKAVVTWKIGRVGSLRMSNDHRHLPPMPRYSVRFNSNYEMKVEDRAGDIHNSYIQESISLRCKYPQSITGII